jgi:hypothetical protein
VENS